MSIQLVAFYLFNPNTYNPATYNATYKRYTMTTKPSDKVSPLDCQSGFGFGLALAGASSQGEKRWPDLADKLDEICLHSSRSLLIREANIDANI